MDKQEYEVIKYFIEKDFENKNIGDLKRIRKMLNDRIERLEEYQYCGEREFTLLQSYDDFYNENFTMMERQHNQLKILGTVFADINFITVRKLRVFQTIGIDEGRILSHPGCGKITLALYEEKLNKHGLSIYDTITPDEYKRLSYKVKELGARSVKAF